MLGSVTSERFEPCGFSDPYGFAVRVSVVEPFVLRERPQTVVRNVSTPFGLLRDFFPPVS